MSRLTLLVAIMVFVTLPKSCMAAVKPDKVSEDRLIISHLGEDGKYTRFEVKSMKMHLLMLSSQKYRGAYVIKEYQSRSLTPGIEGVEGLLKLELWSIGEQGFEQVIWKIEENADSWGVDGEYIFFLDRGCCDVQDKKYIYDIDSLQKIDEIKLERIPVKEQLKRVAYP